MRPPFLFGMKKSFVLTASAAVFTVVFTAVIATLFVFADRDDPRGDAASLKFPEVSDGLTFEAVLEKAATAHDRLAAGFRIGVFYDAASDSLVVSGLGPDRTDIVQMSAAGDIVRRLKGAFAVPSPDGRWLVVVGDDGGLTLRDQAGHETQIGALRSQGGLVDAPFIPMPGHVAWSPDADRLAYVRSRTNPIGIPKGGVLMSYRLKTGETTTVAEIVGSVGSIDWLDASSVLAVSGDMRLMSSRIDRIDVPSGKTTPFAPERPVGAVYLSVAVEPVHGLVAYHSDAVERPPVIRAMSLSVLDRDGGGVFDGDTPLVVRPYQQAKWVATRREALFICKTEALANRICTVSAERDGPVVTDRFDPLSDIAGFAPSPDGRTLFVLADDVFGRRTVSKRDRATGNTTVIYQDTSRAIPEDDRADVVPYAWTAPDGLKLHGLLIRPRNTPQPSPLIVDVHGGPYGGIGLSGAILNGGPGEWHAFAAQGYAVFVADYRAGGVYGPEGAGAGPGGFDHAKDAADVIAGARSLAADGVADPHRMAVVGHSHGAGIVNWLLTMDHPFAAAVSKEGASDWHLLYRRRPKAFRPAMLEEFGADDATAQAILRARSAVSHADRIDTPVLLISTGHGMGETDYKAFEDAIRSAGGTVKRLHFPSEPHVIEDPDHQRIALHATWSFIDAILRAEDAAH